MFNAKIWRKSLKKKKKKAWEFCRNKFIFVPVLHYFQTDSLQWFLHMAGWNPPQTKRSEFLVYYFCPFHSGTVFSCYPSCFWITVVPFVSARWRCRFLLWPKHKAAALCLKKKDWAQPAGREFCYLSLYLYRNCGNLHIKPDTMWHILKSAVITQKRQRDRKYLLSYSASPKGPLFLLFLKTASAEIGRTR